MISQDYQNKITTVPDNPLTLARTCHDGQFSFDPPIIIAQHLLASLFSEIDNGQKARPPKWSKGIPHRGDNCQGYRLRMRNLSTSFIDHLYLQCPRWGITMLRQVNYLLHRHLPFPSVLRGQQYNRKIIESRYIGTF